MRLGARLHAVGNELTAHERVAHAGVGHAQPVAHAHHRTLVRHAAVGVDAGFGVQRLLAQCQVARTHLAAGMEHAHMRPANLVVVLTERLQKRIRGRAEQAIVDGGGTELARHQSSEVRGKPIWRDGDCE